MTEGRQRFIRQLENASKRIEIMASDEIATLFCLRNTDGIVIEPDVAEKFFEVADLTGIGRHELVSLIIRDWLVTNDYMPFHDLDEDTEPDGAA
ncbi:MAG: hypothetical protein WBA42_18160 [Mesorhizobium sp.]